MTLEKANPEIVKLTEQEFYELYVQNLVKLKEQAVTESKNMNENIRTKLYDKNLNNQINKICQRMILLPKVNINFYHKSE